MNSRIFYLLCLPVLAAIGFVAGRVQDSHRIWQSDFEDSGQTLRPGHLPDAQELVASTGLNAADLNDTSADEAAYSFRGVKNSGVNFVYENGPDDQFHLAETLGGGISAVDFDVDGDDDLIFVNGGNPVTWSQNVKRQVSVFQNRSSQFQDQSAVVGIDWTGYGHGCSTADINNDGFDDLLLTGYQSSALFINQGDGTFVRSNVLRDVTSDRWCATAAFCDLDRDGDSDLYIACYADTPRTLPTPVCTSGEHRIHCHPHFYQAQTDLLLENTGDGGFRNRTQDSGVADYEEFGLGVTIADFDGDGSAEIFVANDGDRNLLFSRSGMWAYDESAQASGLAFNGVGEAMGSMGVACADFDRNGFIDLLTTNFTRERNVLFTNLGGLSFVDDSQSTSIDIVSRSKVGWSAITLDANFDGWSELFVANGHVTKMPSQPYAQLPDFFAGQDSGLQSVVPTGEYFRQAWHGRGAVRTDFNGDQKDDLVVSHIDEPAVLLENQSPSVRDVLALKLVGRNSARSANGATIEVNTGQSVEVHHYRRNAGYLSSNSDVLRIGVGKGQAGGQVESVKIRWPSGRRQHLSNLPTGVVLTVVEGRDQP